KPSPPNGSHESSGSKGHPTKTIPIVPPAIAGQVYLATQVMHGTPPTPAVLDMVRSVAYGNGDPKNIRRQSASGNSAVRVPTPSANVKSVGPDTEDRSHSVLSVEAPLSYLTSAPM